MHNVPGLAHISSVATRPGRWGEGLGGHRRACCDVAVASRRVRPGSAVDARQSMRGAQRLYEREGFARSGREKIDDFGEQIVHYVRRTPGRRPVRRPAARRAVPRPRRPACSSCTGATRTTATSSGSRPGGGIEPGEEPERGRGSASGRRRPGCRCPRSSASRPWWRATTSGLAAAWSSDEFFYLARVDQGRPIDIGATDFTAGEQRPVPRRATGCRCANWMRSGTRSCPDVIPILERLGVAPN